MKKLKPFHEWRETNFYDGLLRKGKIKATLYTAREAWNAALDKAADVLFAGQDHWSPSDAAMEVLSLKSEGR